MAQKLGIKETLFMFLYSRKKKKQQTRTNKTKPEGYSTTPILIYLIKSSLNKAGTEPMNF